MSLETSKLLGEIGALFIVVSPIAGSFNTVLGLIGIVLLLVVFNDLADYYKDRSIFTKCGVRGHYIFRRYCDHHRNSQYRRCWCANGDWSLNAYLV